MKKTMVLLRNIDARVERLFTNIGGLLVAVMFVIGLAAGLARDVLHVSMGG
jgi:hypothetical protein